MKKIFSYSILLLCTLVMGLVGCKKQELVFDHEKSMFPINENAVLIEALVPNGTNPSDVIYITGAFSKGELIQMEKAQQSNIKWGVYIFPADCKDGKTLADGFHFVSKKEGEERDLNGKPVEHTLNAPVGTSNNVWIDRWASFFEGTDVKHDGNVLYILNETDWADVYVYAYTDEPKQEVFGGWPGTKINGLETINGVEYRYLDLGKISPDDIHHLIFNNGAGGDGNQFNGPTVQFNKNLFYRLKADLTFEEISAEDMKEHDGPVVYILDGNEWGKSITLYMWGDVNNLDQKGGETAGWPGLPVGGVETIGEHSWYYIDLGAANIGKKEALIFSNNGANQMADLLDYEITDKNLYVYLKGSNPDAPVVIEDPNNIPSDWVIYEATMKEKEPATIDLYLYDATSETFHTMSNFSDTAVAITDTVAALNIYAWGSKDCFGSWPGQVVYNWESTKLLGITIYHTTIECFKDDEFNLIFHNKDVPGGDYQYDAYKISAAELTNEYYLKVGDKETTPLELSVKMPKR